MRLAGRQKKMNQVKKKLDENCVRVIKISKKALFEFIYEKFIEEQKAYLDVDALEVTNIFDINYERGEFVFVLINRKMHTAKDVNYLKKLTCSN